MKDIIIKFATNKMHTFSIYDGETVSSLKRKIELYSNSQSHSQSHSQRLLYEGCPLSDEQTLDFLPEYAILHSFFN